mmetsp:Transcript_57402/g.168074  ORF Transcript_57402/g.168074 Transcript_57402/m.168074 type:complete len:122 (+) Transcript_57402:1-366(+)
MWTSAMEDAEAIHVAQNSDDPDSDDFNWTEVFLDLRGLQDGGPAAAEKELIRRLEILTDVRPITAVYASGEEVTGEDLMDSATIVLRAGTYVVLCTDDEYDAERWDHRVKGLCCGESCALQ